MDVWRCGGGWLYGREIIKDRKFEKGLRRLTNGSLLYSIYPWMRKRYGILFYTNNNNINWVFYCVKH